MSVAPKSRLTKRAYFRLCPEKRRKNNWVLKGLYKFYLNNKNYSIRHKINVNLSIAIIIQWFISIKLQQTLFGVNVL